nr:selenium cofactor biosynthesis protein YqeC [Spirochaeta isovalerica]
MKNGKAVISIAGGGGKTATLFELGRRLSGHSVLLTTTTKIMKPSPSPLYRVLDSRKGMTIHWDLLSVDKDLPLVFGFGSESYPGKLTGVPLELLEEASGHFEYLVVEADGSAGRPLKAPAEHEPVISPLTTIYIGLIGLDVLNCPGDDSKVHRPEIFEQIRGKKQSSPVTPDDLIKLINHKQGLFKSAPQGSRKVILLNKADLIDRKQGESLCRYIKDSLESEALVVLNSYQESEPVLFSL